jgi:hypothetical protein
MAGLVILSGARAQSLGAGEGNVDLAKPLPAASLVAAAGSPRPETPAAILTTQSSLRAGTIQPATLTAAAGAGDGACRSSTCTDQATKHSAQAPLTPTPPGHVLLLAAVGAVAFMARRRQVGD